MSSERTARHCGGVPSSRVEWVRSARTRNPKDRTNCCFRPAGGLIEDQRLDRPVVPMDGEHAGGHRLERIVTFANMSRWDTATVDRYLVSAQGHLR